MPWNPYFDYFWPCLWLEIVLKCCLTSIGKHFKPIPDPKPTYLSPYGQKWHITSHYRNDALDCLQINNHYDLRQNNANSQVTLCYQIYGDEIFVDLPRPINCPFAEQFFQTAHIPLCRFRFQLHIVLSVWITMSNTSAKPMKVLGTLKYYSCGWLLIAWNRDNSSWLCWKGSFW